MFGFSSKPPLDEERRKWIEDSMEELVELLGSERILKARVILPVPEYFPEGFDGSEDSLYQLLKKIGTYMQVDTSHVELNLLADPSEEMTKVLPEWHWTSQLEGGSYREVPEESKIVISVNLKDFDNPIGLIATLAHELGHALLLGDRKIDGSREDMEPLTDLVTVFTGMGIFNANASFQFGQYTSGSKQGWGYKRSGYLSQQMFGYALAWFALARKESAPPWSKYLSPNIRSDFKKSAEFLQASRAEKGNK